MRANDRYSPFYPLNRFVAGAKLVFIFCPAFALLMSLSEIREMWQFKSHATKTALLSIDHIKEISGEGPQQRGHYSYMRGDYVFATAKGDEITVKLQTIPPDVLKRYEADEPVILYYDNDTPQDIRFDGQTPSILSVAAWSIVYAALLVLIVEKPKDKR